MTDFTPSTNPSASIRTGTVPFTYEGEVYQTFYKVYGDLDGRTKTPLVVLHGGPGLIHDYLAPFSDLSVDASIPVITYDQIGNGRSTHLKDKPAEFWTIELFVKELLNLVHALGIQDAFDLAGHSWGGILATEYTVREKPVGLKHLVVADSLAASALWGKSTMELMQTFPKEVQEGLMVGMKEPKKYHQALLAFHAAYGCTVTPSPKEYIDSLDAVFGENGDPTVANAP